MHENRVAVKENDAHLMTSNCIAACTYYAHNIPFLLAGMLRQIYPLISEHTAIAIT